MLLQSRTLSAGPHRPGGETTPPIPRAAPAHRATGLLYPQPEAGPDAPAWSRKDMQVPKVQPLPWKILICEPAAHHISSPGLERVLYDVSPQGIRETAPQSRHTKVSTGVGLDVPSSAFSSIILETRR